MLSVISIIGRPNVGKSTLFNRLTRSRDALVDDTPGVTRDRLYGLARIGERDALVVDTGGIGETDDWVSPLVMEQVESVLEESSHVIMMVDGKDGLTITDQQIAELLGRAKRAVTVAVNKTEGIDEAIACAEFHSLRFTDVAAISAKRGSGVSALLESISRTLGESEDPLWQDPGPKVAVVGRPNVGKSTLINAIAREGRLIVSDTPGTTRDSVVVPLARGKERFRFIDTAGVRRRSKIGESLEALSVVKSLRAIEMAHVAVLVLDASQGVADQDATLAGLVLKAGRPLLIVVSKSDLLKTGRQRRVMDLALRRKLPFASFEEAVVVSGLNETGMPKLVRSIVKAYRSTTIEMPTSELNRILQEAVSAHPPPRAGRRPVKLKYAHQGGRNPPVVVVHGNNVGAVPKHYRRFLEHCFETAYDLFCVKVRVEFRAGKNPYDRR